MNCDVYAVMSAQIRDFVLYLSLQYLLHQNRGFVFSGLQNVGGVVEVIQIKKMQLDLELQMM